MVKKSITINTEITNDLHFLSIEVLKMLSYCQSGIETIDDTFIPKIENHNLYVENLKNRIESISYESIFQLKKKDKEQISNYRSLIKVSRYLSKIAEYLVLATRQVAYIKNKDTFADHNLDAFYTEIKYQVSRIHLTFTEIDIDSAKKLCESEEKLDLLYKSLFDEIQKNIVNKDQSADMLTLLFIIRYFERIGDCFQKIGEAVLAISVGDTLNIKHFENINNIVNDLNGENSLFSFKPFLFSRSGCKVGRLEISNQEKGNNKLFYKHGNKRKIKNEIKGIKNWQNIFPELVPNIEWTGSNSNGSTLVVSHLSGHNLLSFLLEDSSIEQISEVSEKLQYTLNKVWLKSVKPKKTKSTFIKQIIDRKQDILKVHQNFFHDFKATPKGRSVNFKKLLNDANELEKKINCPIQVWCHGDFNLDNILYDSSKKQIYFIDLHRSKMGDYVQEVSVFMVSLLRVKIEDDKTKAKVKLLIMEMYAFAKKWAHEQNDAYFECRLALGLFRSFITSTRFVHDDDWYDTMRATAWRIFKSLKSSQKSLKKYQFNWEIIF